MKLYPPLLWVLLLFLSAILAVTDLVPPPIEAQPYRSRITPGLASIEWGMGKEKVKHILMREGASLEESRYWLISRKGSMTLKLIFTANDELASVETEDDAIPYSVAKRVLTDFYGRPSGESDHLAKWSIGQEGIHLESRSSGVYQRVFNAPLLVWYEMERADEGTTRTFFSNPGQSRDESKLSAEFDFTKPDANGRYGTAQLKLLLVGRVDTQVTKLLGKPFSVTKLGSDNYWHYRDIAYDPSTGMNFSLVQVVFENGIVRRLNFYSGDKQGRR